MNPAPKTALLEPLETAVVPATTQPLLIEDYFNGKPKAKFAKVCHEFKNRYFDETEQPVAEATYRKYKLVRISADGPIIEELGGPARVKGTISAALALIERQGDGTAGFLQTNGFANIFYVPDNAGELCAVRIAWTDGGWLLDAIPVRDPLAWNGKHEIFCPV